MVYIGLNDSHSIPLRRPKFSLPEGTYHFKNGKLRTNQQNSGGYRNDEVPIQFIDPQTQEAFYLDQIGELMYLRKAQEVCMRHHQLKQYIGNYQRDVFYRTESVLPGSLYANMFHLLNPQHLNHVHNLTLTGVRFEGVEGYKETETGGSIKLHMKMYRENIFTKLPEYTTKIPLVGPIIELGKYIQRSDFYAYQNLLDPYTAELFSPIGSYYYVSIIFHVSPINNNKTVLFMDFCSNIPVAKFFQRLVFAHIVPIVVFEDYHHLKDLSKLDPAIFSTQRKNKRVKDTHFLRLHQRFLELYL